MKKVVKFSKLFVPCIVLSGVLMIFSVVGLLYRGINFGLDFRAGFIEKVRVAPTALSLSYKGAKTIILSLNSTGVSVTSTAVDGDSKATSFLYSEHKTFGSFVEALQAFEDIEVVYAEGVTKDTALTNLVVDSQVLPRLSPTPYTVHYIPMDAKKITADDIRRALEVAKLPSDAVQQVGSEEEGIFQIRLPDDEEEKVEEVEKEEKAEDVDEEKMERIISGSLKLNASDVADIMASTKEEGEVAKSGEEKEVKTEDIFNAESADTLEGASEELLINEEKVSPKVEDMALVSEVKLENVQTKLQARISEALNNAFGKDNIVVLGTDFVGSRFSTSLAQQAVILVLGALFLIFLYAMFRFRWDFALGGILALLHDTLAIFAFIVWTRMEFNSISIAAVLTIIGYSINDTVVIFDRIRENITLHPKRMCTEILDISLSEVLGRTIITTLTTMLAAFALYIFTAGSMKDFAMCLIVGMLSGTYSSIYVASTCINFFCRKKKGEEMFVAKASTSGVSV